MSKQGPDTGNKRALEQECKKLERKLSRAEERLRTYGTLVDRTQHLLNTRIAEVEAARRDLSARTKELEESERRFRQLADAAFESILTHVDGVILDCNEAAIQLYGLSRDELVGRKLLDRIQHTHHERAPEWLAAPVDEPVELNHVRGDGTIVPVEVRTRATNHSGRPALVTVVRDITTHKELQEKLHRLANSDPLTGVGNRRFLMDVGKREFFRAARYNHPLSLIMLDVDHFKRLNDTHGHEVGDVALCTLADCCVGILRNSDIFARIGGEEFAALLPNTGLNGAANLAERLRTGVEATVNAKVQVKFPITVSIGVTSMQPEDDGIEPLLYRADRGLYRAKDSGRNRVSVVGPPAD